MMAGGEETTNVVKMPGGVPAAIQWVLNGVIIGHIIGSFISVTNGDQIGFLVVGGAIGLLAVLVLIEIKSEPAGA